MGSWEGNIFVDQIKGEYHIVGITDFERAFWGDPLMELFFWRVHKNIPLSQANMGLTFYRFQMLKFGGIGIIFIYISFFTSKQNPEVIRFGSVYLINLLLSTDCDLNLGLYQESNMYHNYLS